MGDNTGTDAAAQDGTSPLALSTQGENLINSVGANAAAGAVDTVGAALPDLSSAAGANFASGALGQLGSAIGPYTVWLVAGAAVLLLIGMRR